MKTKSLLALLCAVTASAAFAADVVEEKTVTTTTTSSGTIHKYAPGKTFIVKETSGPVTYAYGPKVQYVTRKGRVLRDDEVRTRLKIGLPVHVHYVTEGDRRVVNRIEVEEE